MSPQHRPRGRQFGKATIAAAAAVLVTASAAVTPWPVATAGVAESAPASPATAADAPWSKTVTWLVSQLTPTEQVTLLYRGTDPDNHAEAGYLLGVPRLGIPEIRHADAQGINVSADATAFPTRLGLASSFDRDAYNEMGVQEGRDGLALDVDLLYGPQVDLARFPSWSRNLTTNGEDAYLSGEMASAEVNGIQSQGLMSEVKHVGMYDGQNNATPSLIGSQAARELFLAPAEAAVEQGGVAAAMCSYSRFQIVGEEDTPNYACSNSNMQNKIVKSEWDFEGFITSDYGGSKATSDILAGMDNEFRTSFLAPATVVPLVDPISSSYSPEYAAAVRESDARMLYQYERFGLLDNSRIPAQHQSSVPQHGDVTDTSNGTGVNKAEGQEMALDLARKSGVLMKNEGSALPLSTSGTVAVVGPTATLLPSAPAGERARGLGDRVNITPLKAMKAIAGSDKVVSAPGIDYIGTTVPSANLQTTNDGSAVPGLVRTTTDPSNVTTTSVDTSLAGKQTDLVRGNKYTWTGYLNVSTADTYQLLLQRPYGLDSGNTAAYNKGVTLGSAGAVTLQVDGATKTLANPDGNILQNNFPDAERASNGQYLGKDNTGVNLDLTAGLHQVTITYNPSATAATTPTFRLAWAPLQENTAAAVDAAETADQTVIFVDDYGPGSTAGGPGASTSADLRSLQPAQVDMIETVAAAAHDAGNKVAVVLNSGTAVAMPWAEDVDAVLEMWFPGQEGGTATAELLYGEVNPSGKLPMTFPVDNDHTQWTGHPERVTGSQDAGESTATIKWSEGVNVGYRWYTDPSSNVNGWTPAYAFGSGLSYTSFSYSGLSVKTAADGGLDVTFTIKNTGARDGAEAAQVYLGPSPDLAAPRYDSAGLVVGGFQQSAQKLVQFDRVELAAGEAKTTTVHVGVRQLSAWDTVGQKWVVGTGDRKVMLAAASDDIRATAVKKVLATVVAPAVTTDLPGNVAATIGQTVALKAAASGTPAPTQQWQRSTNGGVTWTDIPGATAPSYAFKVTAADSGVQVRATFTNELGTAMSTPTQLKVAKAASATKVTGPKKVKAGKRFKVKVVVTGQAGRPTGTVVVKATGAKKHKVKLNAKGVATVSYKYGKARTVKVTATYSGDGTHKSSSDHVKVVIRKRR